MISPSKIFNNWHPVDINRERRARYFREVKGNRLIHSIETGDSGRKRGVRKLSCYCDGCIDGCECTNIDYVGAWEEREPQNKF